MRPATKESKASLFALSLVSDTCCHRDLRFSHQKTISLFELLLLQPFSSSFHFVFFLPSSSSFPSSATLSLSLLLYRNGFLVSMMFYVLVYIYVCRK